MIQFHILGVLDLRTADGQELRSVLQQPKRVGVLAYLAVAAPRRFHRRDSLLALFWPELDQEHARAALRRALYFLRTELGAAAIGGRGEEEVGVAGEALWCDAVAFDEAIGAGNADRALALYRGTLLEGLHVAGASSEFQDWLDRERTRLRRTAAGAAASLASAAQSEGRVAEAVGWARRALELEPTDESSLQRLLSLLDRIGDRSAAIRTYDEFARRLAQDLELEPSAETRRLMESLRSRPEPPPSTESPAALPISHGTIAVLPFTMRGGASFAYLGEGMVDLLATRLDGAGEIRTVDPRALLHSLRRSGLETAESLGPEEGRNLAARLGAGRYLLGSILEAGGRLQVTASLYSLGGEVVASVRAAAAGEAGVFELVDELARQLLGAQRVGSGTRITRLAGLTTGSLDALKAYLRGERELRAGRYFDAMDEFQAAVDADASFALAYYRLAAAAAGCALAEVARAVSDQGFDHRSRLAPHDQLLFSAQRAWLHGAVSDAESLYGTITGAYPDDVEAWFHLGDLLFHSNPLRGRSAAEAREPFERVIRLVPDHLAAMVHLARIAAIEGRRGDMLSLIERTLQVSPDGDQALAMRALRAFAGENREAMAEIAGELQGARALTVAIAFADVALYAGNLPGAEMLARSFIQVARSPELRALCHILLAHLAVAGEDWKSASQELQRAETLDPAWGLEVRALFTSLPFAPAGGPEVLEVRQALERWDAESVPASGSLPFAMHNDLHPAIRLYLLGSLDVRLGELAVAGERATALERLASTGEPLARSLGTELKARILRAEGKVEEALALLEHSRPELWFQLTVASPFFSLASQRFLRAELLRELGRPEEAAGWYAAIAERSPYELAYLPAARARLKEIDAGTTR